jgi:hypothetical protein
LILALAAWLAWPLVACKPSSSSDGDGDSDSDADSDTDVDSDSDTDSDGDSVFTCEPGIWACRDNVYFQCGPDGLSRVNETPCEDACDPRLGCVLCVPESRRCEGNVSMVCAPSADAWFHGRDCTDWGSTCLEATGYCSDACAEAESGDSYMGCEYWPVPLANTNELDRTLFDYRLVVANPNDAGATVRIMRGTTEVRMEPVAANGLVEITLPWIDAQSFGVPEGDWQSLVQPDGAYRLLSDLPVTVVQFNPFEYSAGAVFSYTNDASLLLPTHVLNRNYVALTYVPFSRRTGIVGQGFTHESARYPDYVALVGISPEPANVEIQVRGHVRGAGGAFGDTPPGGTINLTLHRGEVVHLTSGVPPDCLTGRPGYTREEECEGIPPMRICNFLDTCRETEYDLTGSRITADRPIEVFGGHVCAYVPYTAQACDHLEIQLPPIETWGTDFVSAPMVDAGTTYPNLVRVVAAFDGTRITVDPPQDGVGTADLAAGEWVEFLASTPFHVTGTEAIMVGQFLLGQHFPEPDAARGDPALTILVPEEQYRTDYIFVTPSSYRPDTNGQSYVMIVRPPGLELTLDGAAVSTTWQPIAGREIGVVPVAGGSHTIAGELPFGLVAFGLGSYTSYAYPAGLDLEAITVVY